MIIPVIFEDSFEKIETKVRAVANIAKIVQIDIADGVLTDEKTFTKIEKLEQLNANLELHLMVKEPNNFLFKKLRNAARICVQEGAGDFINAIVKFKNLGYITGVSLNPNTKLPNGEILDAVDYVQYMSVIPGGGGREFIPEVLENIREFRKHNKNIEIQIDGGINENNIKSVADAGVNNIVVGHAIFSAKNPREKLIELNNMCENIQNLP